MKREKAESAFFFAEVTETFLGFFDKGFLRVGVDALDSPFLVLLFSADFAVGFGCACRGNRDMVSFLGDVVSFFNLHVRSMSSVWQMKSQDGTISLYVPSPSGSSSR